MEAFRSALQLDFLLSRSSTSLIYPGGVPQQLVQLFICLSSAYRHSLTNLQGEYMDGNIVPE